MSGETASVVDELFADMLPDFLDEATENLERLNEYLLELDERVKSESEEGFDAAVLNEMFRAAHTLKGLSGMLGLKNINALTHKVENVFDAARSNELEINSDVVEVIFHAFDHLSEMVTRLKDGQDDSMECRIVLGRIGGVLQKSGVERSHGSNADIEQALAGVSATMAEHPPINTTTTEQSKRPPESVVTGANELPIAAAASKNDDTSTNLLPATAANIFSDIADDVDLTSRYIPIFVDEAELTLDELTETLLAGADDNVTEKVLVLCHRMKGSAAAVGLNRAAKMAHSMEDLVQVLRDDGKQLSVEMTDAMLDCAEALRQFVGGIKLGELKTELFPATHQKLIQSQQRPGGQEPRLPAVKNVEPAADDVASNPTVRLSSTSVSEGPSLSNLTEELCTRLAASAPSGQPSYAGTIRFRDNLPAVGLKIRLLYDKLSHIGELFYSDPSDTTLDEAEDLRVWTFAVATDESEASLRAKAKVDGVSSFELCPLQNRDGAMATFQDPSDSADAADVHRAATALSSTAASSSSSDGAVPADKAGRSAEKSEAASKPTETVRVDIDRLDQLMNLAGQLVINKARFSQISSSLRQLSTGKQSYHSVSNIFGSLKRLDHEIDSCERFENSGSQLEDMRGLARRIQSEMENVQRRMGQFDDIRSSINELLEAVHQLDRVSDGIQKCVMDTRMVPVGPLFARFKRVVRDISRSNNKEIRLVIRGEKTELDKRMIDELGDPLIHIVRNSADHGIELPEARAAAGKSREGTITLDASHRGNSIVIQVIDDGKGLDAQKIRNKAVEKGLMSQADADKLTDLQAYQLIWEPGLSTAEKITEVSGRGMGMDIVRSKIEDINGTVELDSKVGVGTTITIKLPLTLAILPSLLAEIDGDVFAIPVEAVSEIVRIETGEISQVHGLATATVRGRVMSVVQLTQLFEWSSSAKSVSADNGVDRTLVIVGSDDKEVGLVVDNLLGEEDIVIKSLAENYRNVEGIAGASILGDGRVSLILDVGALVARSSLVGQQTCRA